MPDLSEARRKLKIAIGAMVAVDVLALGIIVSPLVGSTAARKTELNQLWQELQARTREVEPLRGLDKKIPVAEQQINLFYRDRLPGRESEIAEALGKLASQSGVKLLQAKYKFGDQEAVQLRPVLVEADIEGSYPELARFVNALERSQVFFIVDSVSLAEQNGPVRLQLKLETYMKTGS
jgi:Tfp pilus assembly protein PilO